MGGNGDNSNSKSKRRVAKTATALNLGAGLNNEDRKVLLIDLDLQMDLTLGLAIPETKFTIDDVVNGKDISKAIVKLENGLSIIPASKDLRVTQMSLKKPWTP
jgi:chromosome partitioning protein